MTDHATQLQQLLDAAMAEATARPTTANIAAVEKARRALDDYQGSADTGDRFKTQAAALEYLQKRWKIEKSKLSKDVQDGRCPRKDGHFTARDLDFYASASHLEPRTSEPRENSDHDDRLRKAQADEREIRVAKLRNQLIDAAEEEARDARLWYAVRADIENEGPRVIDELINRIASLGLPDEHHARIVALRPKMRLTYEDTLAEIFDRLARSGGIEA